MVSIVLGLWMPPEGESRATSWIDGAAILLAVFLVSGVTAGNDYHKDKQFRALSQIHAEKKVKVVRQGRQMTISSYDLVVGDIVLIGTGDNLQADMLLLVGHNVVCDESSLTGGMDLWHNVLGRSVLIRDIFFHTYRGCRGC